MTQTDSTVAAATTLERLSAGTVLRPGDRDYEAARLPWNRRIDPRPAVVVEAGTPEDVRLGVLVAREQGLPFAVQSTGHGTLVPSDGGLLLKTSRLSAVEIDPERRTARVGPGALWSDVIAAAEPYGLAPLSGTPSVGVAGYTLGGGAGWLSRKYGYAADSVLRAEVVTDEAEVVVADAEQNPDLFWGLRGGSGNFGVVTSLEFRLYPVGRVFAGMSFYPVERAQETLVRYREWAGDERDELSTAVMLLQLPPAPELPEMLRGRRVLAIRAFFLGSRSEAEWHLDPLLEVAGSPLVDGFRSKTFAEAGEAIAPAHPPMAARQQFELFRELSDSVIDRLCEAAGEGVDSPLSAVEVRHWGGAPARPGPDAGPVGHRDAPFSVIATALLDGAADRWYAEEVVDSLAADLRTAATGGSFLNFLTDPAKTRTAFTADDYRRLVNVKQTWDQDNFFRLNHNIPPEELIQ